MNSYSIVGGEFDGTPTGKAILKACIVAFANANLFGFNSTNQPIVEDGNVVGHIISFDLAYSINQIIKGLPPVDGKQSKTGVIETVYNTACQEVREYVDSPFIRVGNMVCFAVFGDDKAFRGDMNNYIQVPFGTFKQADESPVKLSLVVGISKAGLSEFFKPLQKYVESGFIEIIDAQSAENISISTSLGATIRNRALLATAGSSAVVNSPLTARATL